MGYRINIGEAVWLPYDPVEEEGGYWTVDDVQLASGPAFPGDEMSNYTNVRRPSYSAWAYFCKDTGVWPVFFEPGEVDRVKGGYPSTIPITPEMLGIVQTALQHRQSISVLPPGYSSQDGVYDYDLARLIWLEFWMRWAFENFNTPAIRIN